MKTVYLVLLAVVVKAGVAQYQWACTEPDGAGQRYVPSERDRDVVTSTTGVNQINIYSVDSLNQDCSGEVTAIEYCYVYDVGGTGEAVFNWTVLILADTGSGNFRITNSYTIESRPDSSSSVNCGAASSGRKDCCDVDQINGFNLSVNFFFGVTGPSQGNTHSATLLGFADALPQYRVNTVIQSSAGLSLSVGSTLPSTPVLQRGLRMLWFVIESTDATTNDTAMTTAIKTNATTADMATAIEPHATTIVSRVTDPASGESDVEATSQSNIGLLVGVTVPSASFVVLVAIFIVVVGVLLLVIKKGQGSKTSGSGLQVQYHDEAKPGHVDSTDHDDEKLHLHIPDMENMSTEDNVAYGQTAPQISTENNIAYVQSTTMSTEDNVAYGHTALQISTEDNVANYGHTAPQISTEDDVGYVVTENDYSEIIGGDNQYDYVHV